MSRLKQRLARVTQWLQLSRRRTSWLLLISRSNSRQSRPGPRPGLPQHPVASRSRNRSVLRWCIVIGTVVSLSLTGCASTVRLPQAPTPVRTPPAAAMAPCIFPGSLLDGMMSSLVLKLDETVGALAECAHKHKQLTDWIIDGQGKKP